jgi:predicted alpha/beta-hydrolase family hydrolase
MELLIDGPDVAPFTIVFAHGAGVGMDAHFMTTFATALAAQGNRVVRFEFPYMAERRKDGTRRPPDKPPVLFETFLSAIREAGASPEQVVLAGKSMGGRFATMMADQLRIAAVLVYGYPFHPPGKPENLRTAHLAGLKTPTLICQGTRDPFGTKEEVEGYELSPAIELCWLEDGDHGFKPRKASGLTEQMNWTVAIEASAGFLERVAARR